MNETVYDMLVSIVKILIGLVTLTALIIGTIFLPFVMYYIIFKVIGMLIGFTIGVWASVCMTVFTLFLIACIK